MKDIDKENAIEVEAEVVSENIEDLISSIETEQVDMGVMEFKMLEPAKEEDLSKAMIKFNNEQLKQQITAKLKSYEGLTYTDETISVAKKDRSSLNNLSKALNDRRISVKKEYMKPYDSFKEQVDELIALIEKPVSEIDKQVKDYEEKEKQKKKDEILDYYDAEIGDLKTLLPIERLQNDKWMNVTYKMKDIKSEIKQAITKVGEDLAVIENLGTEFELQVKDKYLKTLDLTEALKENTRLMEEKKKQEEYNRKKEEERKQREEEAARTAAMENARRVASAAARETEPPAEAVEPTTEQLEPAPAVDETETAPEAEPLKQIDFRVWVNEEQKQELRQFLIDNRIKYGSVK